MEDLKGCLREATRKEKPVISLWEKVVQLIQLVIEEGGLLEELTWVTMLFLLKG